MSFTQKTKTSGTGNTIYFVRFPSTLLYEEVETMKKKRTEMDIARFEKTKRKYEDKDQHDINFELYNQRNNRDKWEKKFMLDQYEYRIPEKEELRRKMLIY